MGKKWCLQFLEENEKKNFLKKKKGDHMVAPSWNYLTGRNMQAKHMLKGKSKK